ncbi:MAG: DUF1127 domain-containing protein [Mesorhizobium sp.]|nr:DUF1127 domain-containing protein [Mesorhizobium sp.]MBL8579537.1 DUF1127 domain-containing protein [Mesorhizobium sp.]
MSTFTTTRTDTSMRTSESRGGLLLRLISMIEMAVQRRRSRIALMELSDDLLKDIGVSRSEAFRESNRPFWD